MRQCDRAALAAVVLEAERMLMPKAVARVEGEIAVVVFVVVAIVVVVALRVAEAVWA